MMEVDGFPQGLGNASSTSKLMLPADAILKGIRDFVAQGLKYVDIH